ncbi:MAG: molybdenum cofactor guanylyltransferase [Candidatus Bathyarchaeota archaeon]|nr:molybdenum cofactor guanylyltransferase [Candidatus Bathyarchaeota archaeon]
MQTLIQANAARVRTNGENGLDRSAIVLAGGFSSRFGQDKGVLELGNKPLMRHVIEAVNPIVDETIVVTNSEEKIRKYAKIAGQNVRFVVDVCESQGPLIGALTGFDAAHGKYALLVPFDTPFVSREVVTFLFELCIGKAAAIPRWPNEHIEPLHAVYQTKLALEAARQAVNEGKLNMRAMIAKLRGVRYVSTLVIQQLDPDLKTFLNINTPLDLKRAMAMIKPRKTKR